MTVMVVCLSEPLRPKQGVGEIDHEPDGHERRERVVEDHGRFSSEPVARDRVTDRQRKKAEPNDQHDEVKHGNSPLRNESPLEEAPRNTHKSWEYVRLVRSRRGRSGTSR